MSITHHIFKFLPLILAPLGLVMPLAPRSTPVFVLLLGIFGIMHYIRNRPSLTWLKTRPVAALVSFILYLFASVFWSEVPERSLDQAIRLTAVAFFGLAGFSLLNSLSESDKKRLTGYFIPALTLCVITGCTYGLLQYTGPYVRMMTDFIGVDPEFAQFWSKDNRLHIAKTMLLTNMAFFTLLSWSWHEQKIISIFAYCSLLTVCFYSDSQSSFVTCVAGGMLFFALKLSQRSASKIVMASLVASFILVVPITQSPYLDHIKSGVKSTSLGKKTSPDQRILIYQLFGTLSLDKPLLGHGLMTGVKYEGSSQVIGYNGVRQDIRTPHNIHLQVIFDLGFIGAGVLVLALLWPIWRFVKTDQSDLATSLLLPICVMIAGTAFNLVIWRTWIPSATILSVFFLFISFRKPDYQALDRG